MIRLFRRTAEELSRGNDLMLVTLTANDGSVPRKAGAQMLVGASGRILGTIGGGSVEYRAEQMALSLIPQRRSLQHTFTLNLLDKEGLGMVCGGSVSALFTFIDANDPFWQDLCSQVLRHLEDQSGGMLALSYTGEKPVLSEAGAPDLPDAASFFLLPLPVVPRAVLFGGGHVSAALAPLLSTVGFRIWVMDNRPELITEGRFPTAEQRIAGDYAQIDRFIGISGKDYVVVMTNGHRFDLEVEAQVLQKDFAYLGVIGSRKKIAAVNQTLTERGFTAAQLARVHTPIGLPINAVTPEEIAVSIAAEMIRERALLNGIDPHPSCPMH